MGVAMKIAGTVLMLSFAICSFAVMAGKPLDLTRIVEQQRSIARQIESPETTGLQPRQIEAIRAAQTDVFAAIGENRELSELTADERVQLKNALEGVDVAMKGTPFAERNREKCWREKKVGTQLKVTRCATQAEIDELREGARAWYEKSDICDPSTGSCGAL
jgi:hypothetical protein